VSTRPPLLKGAATGGYRIEIWNNADTTAELYGFAEIPSATGATGGAPLGALETAPGQGAGFLG
jgi:hypothetical protein